MPHNTHAKIQGLDTLRFFAFFWVFCLHSTPGLTAGNNPFFNGFYFLSSCGGIGIDIFFVLSSFLLTYLGLQEKHATGSFSTRNFLIRRALRIFPLYYLVVAVCFIVFPLLAKVTTLHISLPPNPLYFIFFAGNYIKEDYIFALKCLWSLAVEEQYYWTWALLLLLTRKNFFIPAVIFLAAYLVLFYLLPVYKVQAPENPFMFLADFSIGSLLAIFYFNNRHKLNLLLLLACAAACFAGWRLSVNGHLSNEKFPLSLFIAFIILLVMQLAKYPAVQRNGLYKLLERLGVYTYGLYVYGGFAITVVPILFNYLHIAAPFYLIMVTEFILLLGTALLSYHLYEKRFLNYSRKFRRY